MTRPLGTVPILILAGGLGSRLRSAVNGLPKALAPIHGKPFLQIQMELLRDQGARHFVLCVGYLSEQVFQTFGMGERLGVSIDYSEEKDDLRGTGGALKLAERFFSPRAMVLNGDTFLDFDHNKLVECHSQHLDEGVAATCTLARVDDPTRFGSVDLDDEKKYLRAFREKTSFNSNSGWLNAGAYLLEKSLLNEIPEEKAVSLEREVFPSLLNQGAKIGAICSDRPFYDIGTPKDLERFRSMYGSCLHDRHRVA